MDENQFAGVDMSGEADEPGAETPHLGGATNESTQPFDAAKETEMRRVSVASSTLTDTK